ncbi:MAG: hypothetical protein ABI432_12535 [Flavobacteriales bacterium]
MRYGLATVLYCLVPWVHAQVHVSGNVHVTGTDDQRRVDGIAAPLDVSSAVTVEAAVLGGAHWATAALSVDTLLLTLSPSGSLLHEGTLIRFKAPAALSGPLFIRNGALTALPLLRADGLALVPGQMITNAVVEIILATDHYVFVSSAGSQCPPGSLPFNDRTCMDVGEVDGLNMFEASEYCATRGGKLCTWDEYYAGCALLGTGLTARFDDWEWVDDTSNHTQTADQVGRTTCMSQRAAGPLNLASTRCCYHPR